jgi:sugar (pentulose or hexulose) kinase
MSALPVIAIFDIGKTNKKFFLFNENYEIVFEKSTRLIESTDEDGFPCENLEKLTLLVFESLEEVFKLKKFKVTTVNFSTYGASFVYVDKDGKPLTHLYNYLKPFPNELSERFYATYGGKEKFSIQTSSPVLGSLNSGLQLYRLKYEKPDIFKNLHFALHLPQYLSYLVTGMFYSDITSIGSHTALWDFNQHKYHDWVNNEALIQYLAPIENSDKTFPSGPSINKCKAGIGLHDSSAALIPYLVNFKMPFILISTGTWSISMNPFNKTHLTVEELKNDCLRYLQYQGEPVKASRLHAGLEYEQQLKRIAEHYNRDIGKYQDITYNPDIADILKSNSHGTARLSDGFRFHKRDLSEFKSDIEAYYTLVIDLMEMQFLSTRLVIDGPTVKRIFVDGGFSKNSVYMNLLANAFPEMEVFAASMAQATAVGVALAIHQEWNSKPIPNDIIELKYYSSGRDFRL